VSNIFFDLDGTLSDPKVGIINSLRYALEKTGISVLPDIDLTWCIGPPLQDSLIKITGSVEHAELALTYFRKRYSEIGLYENSLYEHVAEGLNKLKKNGYELAVVTSKPKPFANTILAHFNIDSYFTFVFGMELDGSFSDKADLLRSAIVHLDAKPSDSVMIGDREHDIIAAHKNAVRSIGVLYGFGSKSELMGAGADKLVDNSKDLFQSLIP